MNDSENKNSSGIKLDPYYKTLAKTDLEYIEMLFTKDIISHKYMNKILPLLKRFLR